MDGWNFLKGMTMTIGTDPGAHGVAALSLVSALLDKLIDQGVIAREDVVDMCNSIATAKLAKTDVYRDGLQVAAAQLLSAIAIENEARA